MVQETLRINPVTVSVVRTPIEDDVLPLAKPIVGTSGRVYIELPIPKGTPVTISTVGYNLSVFFLHSHHLLDRALMLSFVTGTRICGARTLMCSDQNVGSKWMGKQNRPLGCMVTCMVTRGVLIVLLSIDLSFFQLYVLRRR